MLADPLFVTQTIDPSQMGKAPLSKSLLQTPSLQHLFAKYLASDEDERFPYNTLYSLLHLEINCESPKTKQAMNNLEIKIEDLIIKPFENYFIKHEAEEISNIRYQSHLQTVACIIIL